MEASLKRLYVGGISPLVTKAELADRFGKFGKISDVDIIYRKDEQGNPIKTFAYLNINISDVDLKKCIAVLNKTKWKGGVLQIEIAKESCLHRLSQERQAAKDKEKANARSSENKLVLSLGKAGVPDFQMKVAVPGTEVPHHKNWVVSKFGRVLPVLQFNGKKQRKVMKYDPSKYCHNIKKIDDTFELVSVSQLTWQLEGVDDDEISRKRRGDFQNPMSPPKKQLINQSISGANDTQTDQRIPLASVQTAERQSDRKKPLQSNKLRYLQNRSMNHMTEHGSEEELQAVLKKERAARGTVNCVKNSNIEVVDDSFELGSKTHWEKPIAALKMNSNSLDDNEYDSANTDEIIAVAKTVQNSDNFKASNKQMKKGGSTHACGTKGNCKSKYTVKKKSESGASEDSSDSYSDEEYESMMQNCFQLDLEILAKANEFDNAEVNYDEFDTQIINAKQGYGIAEDPLALGFEILTAPKKKQNARCVSADLKKKLKTCNKPDNSDSELNEHYESINKICTRQNVETEALEPKSPTSFQSLVNNHVLEKEAKGLKGERTKNQTNPGSGRVKKKRAIEPEDIAASILDDDRSSGLCSSAKKKKDAPVKPPAFKGLSSVLASATTMNSQFGSPTMSNVNTAAVARISNCLNVSSKQTKKAEKTETSIDLRQIFLEAKSKYRSSSSDTSEECNNNLSCTSSAAKPAISQIGTTKEQTTSKVKQQQDNQKRLVAMMEWGKERELQKQIIQGALLQLDSLSSKNSQHIVFHSESESEKEEEASTSKKIIVNTDKKAKESTSKLFNSSEEDSDNEDKKDHERFKVKAQYQGSSGMKLMELQSCFGTDERFKMDFRFLESSSEDEESTATKNSKIDEHELSTEKKKNLDILQSLLNMNMEPQPTSKQTAKGKKFKDLNALHYDPAKEDHVTFETKVEEKKESKSERAKKRLAAEKLPIVSKETYHEIIMDFREVFGTSKTQESKTLETAWDQEVDPGKNEADKSMSSDPFSFQNKNTEEFAFSFFGISTEESTSNNEPYMMETGKPAKVAWQEDPVFQDSSTDGEDVEDATVATENMSRSTRPDGDTICFFFFVKDDKRLKTGPKIFFQSSNTKQEEEAWEQRQDILLEECRKMHKDAKRKTKTKN